MPAEAKSGVAMHCFAHEGTAAVGVCGKCGKGVCRGCAIDLGFRLVCSENCGALARSNEALQVGVERMWGIAGGKPKMPLTVIMCGLVGAIMLCFGIYHFLFEQWDDWLSVVLGSAFIVFALLSFQRSHSFWRSVSQ
jgi:hypothetical protein